MRRLFGEVWRGDFPRSVARTFEDLEAFFLSEDRQRRLAGMGLVRRWLYFGAWLFKSLFLNLTPARRVLLALALLLLWVRAQWGAGGHALRVDFVTHEDGRVGLVLADVSGKGLPAALLMARLQATVLAFVPDLPSLAALASRLHKAFRTRGLENRFATLVYLQLEPGSSRIRLVNAGHMPPLVVGPGQVQPLPAGGPALGIPMVATHEEESLDLGAGQTLVVHSDPSWARHAGTTTSRSWS